VRPTRYSVLVLLAAVAGAAAYAVTRSSYDSLPRPGVTALSWVAILTIAEFYIALMTRARLAGRAGTKRINPLVVARFVALAKASSIVGSLATGVYAGFLIWVARLGSPAANTDTKISAVGTGLSMLLVAAAMFLEHVCRVPKRDDDDQWPEEDTPS
jgi:uncharacterized membrane protein YbhN (UPF0104 family)